MARIRVRSELRPHPVYHACVHEEIYNIFGNVDEFMLYNSLFVREVVYLLATTQNIHHIVGLQFYVFTSPHSLQCLFILLYKIVHANVLYNNNNNNNNNNNYAISTYIYLKQNGFKINVSFNLHLNI